MDFKPDQAGAAVLGYHVSIPQRVDFKLPAMPIQCMMSPYQSHKGWISNLDDRPAMASAIACINPTKGGFQTIAVDTDAVHVATLYQSHKGWISNPGNRYGHQRVRSYQSHKGWISNYGRSHHYASSVHVSIPQRVDFKHSPRRSKQHRPPVSIPQRVDFKLY